MAGIDEQMDEPQCEDFGVIWGKEVEGEIDKFNRHACMAGIAAAVSHSTGHHSLVSDEQAGPRSKHGEQN